MSYLSFSPKCEKGLGRRRMGVTTKTAKGGPEGQKWG